MEDLSCSYVQGSHYDEDNDYGAMIRENYTYLLEAAAQLHARFWEDRTVFAQAGLDWRHASKENLLQHISGIKRDFEDYREKEGNHQIPRTWNGLENTIQLSKLNIYEDAMNYLHNQYPKVLAERIDTGRYITVVHGDLHPGNMFISKFKDRDVKLIDFQAVRIGLCTEDLAMLLSLHIQPDKKQAQPLLDRYYFYLTRTVKDYPYELFRSDLRLSIAESLFFPLQLFRHEIYDFAMRDRALKAYETYVMEE